NIYYFHLVTSATTDYANVFSTTSFSLMSLVPIYTMTTLNHGLTKNGTKRLLQVSEAIEEFFSSLFGLHAWEQVKSSFPFMFLLPFLFLFKFLEFKFESNFKCEFIFILNVPFEPNNMECPNIFIHISLFLLNSKFQY
ncbi:hypothetical protein ACJX0J_027307, partial [Zea mays]